jgi:CTP:molybdopterin cytidylyltransferase MocA
MKIACVVLAAGAGTRMGGVAKALLRRGEQSFLQCIVHTAQADEVVVVVGPPYGDAVAAHARELGARVVVNEDPRRGMSSSIKLGFASLDADAAWLWPVDHPDVSASTLRTLYAELGARDIARPICDGRGGHPPLIKRAVFAQLVTCENAREVINAADVVNVEVEDRGTIEDIDR